MVVIGSNEDAVIVRMTREEAQRLSFAISAGYETVSRAEYYIRHGLSQPQVRQLVDAIETAVRIGRAEMSVPLEPGVEEIENPRRPRPQR
jgi:hypothetical protein